MRQLRSLRLWFGVPAVLVGVAIGLLANIATTAPSLPAIAGLVAAVAMLVILTVRQAGRDEQARVAALRAARASVLTPLRPELAGAHTISTLLAPEYALAPFRARRTETRALTSWCLDAAAPAVRVLAGRSGVGKSRLAVEVAGKLPDEWVAGYCAGGEAADLLPAVLACAEPTLVVVDDADTEPGVAALIEQIGERAHRSQVKVLLLVRDAAAFEQWVHQDLPRRQRGHLPTTTLAVAGAASDRRRWFVEATRAYATALRVAPPPLSDVDARPVSADGEPMVVTQARAALAALAGTRARADALRTAGIDRVATELVEHEQQRWNRAAEDSRWGLADSVTAEARLEALLALVLLAPATVAEATGVLRRLPRFRDQTGEDQTDENLLRKIVAWAHHLYPGPGPAQVEPSPDFLRGALLAVLTLPAQAEITDALLSALSTPQGSAVLTRLIRATALFGTVAPLVGKVVHQQPGVIGAAIESLILTGPTARGVERHLLVAITPDMFGSDEINRLIDLLGPTQFNHLRAAVQECAVQHARDALDNDDTEDARAALARSLTSLGASLREVGRSREALAVAEEAVGLWRGLAVQEPARHTAELARSLNNLGISLREVGRSREALALFEEAVGLWRGLAGREPARHTAELTQSLTNTAIGLCELGRHDEELELRAEATVRWRILSQLDPDTHNDAYQRERDRLASSYSEHGREPDAAWRAEQAAAHRLGLETPPPDRPA